MLATLINYLWLYFLACLKSILPPLLGPAFGLSNLEIIVITVAGLMTSVVLFNFLGERIKAQVIPIFIKKPKKFSPKSRRMVRIWRKYGIVGVCFLTPLVLSPPGGALLVATVGAPRRQVFLYMLIFGVFWAVVWTFSVDWLIQIGLVGKR
ncbi:hypothetical protein [Roseivirga thermotolerans]|uniref:hypothetical protein n=1 Tax=Roseivirga thermotolerans TaxID=1758176 RepID=UPI00273EC756|nr:hypothetical protein [Roseivirga thermotolerans]